MSRTRKQKRKGGVKYTAANLKLLEESRKRLRTSKPVSRKMRKTIKVRYVPKIQSRKTLRYIKKEPIIEKFKRVRKFLKEFVRRFEGVYEENDEYKLNNYSIVIEIIVESLKELADKYSTILDEEIVDDAKNINTSDPDVMIEFIKDYIDEMKSVIETVRDNDYTNEKEKIIYNEFIHDVYSEIKQLVKKYKDELDKPKNEIAVLHMNNNNINNGNNVNNDNNDNNNIKMNTQNISKELYDMLSKLRL
jgi:hypothetical protein